MKKAPLKILITGKMSEESLGFLKKEKSFSVEYSPGLSGDALSRSITDANAMIIRTETLITRDLLTHAQKLKVICRSGIGIDHIDLGACADKKIKVMNTPEANRNAATEHTLALMLSLSRHIPQASATLKAGGWSREQFEGVELSQKVLGIIGLGNIGQRVATLAQGFGMKVIAHDPYLKTSVAKSVKVKLLSLNEVLKNSDYVSFHVPLTHETQNMADKKFFKQMKPTAFLINTSRGKVVNERALAEALTTNQIRGAALDVFEEEPISADNPLLKFENLILTPHVAGQTAESQIAMGMDAARQIRNFLKNGTVVNSVLTI